MKNGINMAEAVSFVLKQADEMIKVLGKTKMVLPPYKMDITQEMMAKIYRECAEIVPRKIIKGYDEISPKVCKKITEVYELLAMVKQACEDMSSLIETEERSKSKIVKNNALFFHGLKKVACAL